MSHFRLAAHLLVALTTLAGLVWTALDLRELARGQARARLTRFGALVLAMLFFQLFMGAMVAGLRAGYVAGSGWFSMDAWPLMQGTFFPDGVEWAGGALHALVNDPFLTHFVHRWWAWAVVAVLIVMARRLKAMRLRKISVAIHCAFGIQVILGICTIWSGVALWLAVAHQLCGALLVAATAWGAHGIGRRDQVGLGM